jgi:hypothetical protein
VEIALPAGEVAKTRVCAPSRARLEVSWEIQWKLYSVANLPRLRRKLSIGKWNRLATNLYFSFPRDFSFSSVLLGWATRLWP